jgi:integrase
MASVANDPNGRKRVQFMLSDGERKTIRLGKCDRKYAEKIAGHVEDLLAAKIGAQSLAPRTASWLADIDEVIREKLVAVGLVEAQQRLTVGEFVTTWLASKQAAGHKPTSLRAWGQTTGAIVEHFGERPLSSLNHADGEAFRSAMQGRKLRATTIHKRLGHARQMLEDGVRLGHLTTNPWKHVRHRAGDPSERRAYVPVADAERVIDHCPNVWWRLLVALARFGGLRVPSEALSLTWRDVDWERGRLSVPSPKTEHLGKPHRILPLFPLLRPHLDVAYQHAKDRSVFIFPDEMRQRASGPMGWGGANLRTTFAKIVRRAGVSPWPRVWHSLRASCESDLAQSFPLATVTKWLGNTPSVALRHYVDPTEAAFDRAQEWVPERQSGGAKCGAPRAQNEAQRVTVESRGESQESAQLVACRAIPQDPANPRDIMDESKRECMGRASSSAPMGRAVTRVGGCSAASRGQSSAGGTPGRISSPCWSRVRNWKRARSLRMWPTSSTCWKGAARCS